MSREAMWVTVSRTLAMASLELCGAGGFDGRVQRQQVGLVGDGFDVFQQREDAVQVLRHLVDVLHGVAALAADLFQRFHQLLHLVAGVLREAGHVDTTAAFFTGTVDDAGQRLALLPRLAAHRIEAAAKAGHRLADQFTGALDFTARAVDFVADEAAQLVEQLVLLLEHAGVFRGALGLAVHAPVGEHQPAQDHRGQDRPHRRRGPRERGREREQESQGQRGGQADSNA